MKHSYRYTNRKVRLQKLWLLGFVSILSFAVWIYKLIRLSTIPIYPTWYHMKHASPVSGRTWMQAFSLPWLVLTIIFVIELLVLYEKTNKFDVTDFHETKQLYINRYATGASFSRHKPYFMQTTEKLTDGTLAKFTIGEHIFSDKEIRDEFISGNITEDQLNKVIKQRKYRVIIQYNREHESTTLNRYFATLDEAEEYINKFKHDNGGVLTNE